MLLQSTFTTSSDSCTQGKVDWFQWLQLSHTIASVFPTGPWPSPLILKPINPSASFAHYSLTCFAAIGLHLWRLPELVKEAIGLCLSLEDHPTLLKSPFPFSRIPTSVLVTATSTAHGMIPGGNDLGSTRHRGWRRCRAPPPRLRSWASPRGGRCRRPRRACPGRSRWRRCSTRRARPLPRAPAWRPAPAVPGAFRLRGKMGRDTWNKWEKLTKNQLIEINCWYLYDSLKKKWILLRFTIERSGNQERPGTQSILVSMLGSVSGFHPPAFECWISWCCCFPLGMAQTCIPSKMGCLRPKWPICWWSSSFCRFNPVQSPCSYTCSPSIWWD